MVVKAEPVNGASPVKTTKAADLLSKSRSSNLAVSLTTLKLKTKQQELLIRVSILGLVYILAFITRLFSVLRYESMIHEFDPYFNYRTTLYLTEKGFYDFWNWFDSESWYPLGRIIGGTLYPGLMVTAALIYWALRFLSAPFFASNTTIVAYLFGKEIWDTDAGLVAVALIAICPGYISRSVAGSYDNEGVAIFALLLTFYLFVKAVNTGSLAWSLASALGYFYMVSAWGGYVFIINLIPPLFPESSSPPPPPEISSNSTPDQPFFHELPSGSTPDQAAANRSLICRRNRFPGLEVVSAVEEASLELVVVYHELVAGVGGEHVDVPSAWVV